MDSQDQEMYYTNLLSQDHYPVSLDDSPPLQANSETNVNKSVRARGANFSEEEDKLLVSAWLNCSLDGIQGTDQKHSQLWEKILEYFDQYKETTTERTMKSLIHRWSGIQKATNKFCAKLAQLEGLNQSGTTEHDKLEKAKIMYKSLEKSNFQFEHCWHLLKDQPKWISRSTKVVPKQIKTMVPPPTLTPPTTSSPMQNAIDNEVIELDRPMGRKAEKRKRNAQGRQAEEFFELRKMKYALLEESRAQEKDFYRLKAEKMEYDKEKDQCKIRQEDEKLRIEAEKMEYEKDKEQSKIRQEDERLRLEAEKIEIARKESDQRVMMMDVSIMPETQRFYFEKLQKEIMMRDNHV